jgi:hypothetical protein
MRLEETLKATMYWTNMRKTVQLHVNKTINPVKLTKNNLQNMENFPLSQLLLPHGKLYVLILLVHTP